MADTSMTIDDADEREELNGEEYLPSSYGGEPYKISTDSIKGLVIAKLEELSPSIAALGESDCVFATIADGFHKPTVAVVVQSVYNILMGKAAASSLTDATMISVDQPVTARGVTTHVPKTTTLADLAAYVAAEIGEPTFDVHALTSTTTPLSDADETPLAQGVQQGGTTVWSTLKTTLSTLATYVIGKLRSVAVESTEVIDPDDEMMIFDKSQYHVFKRAKFSALGIGAGNVTAPAAHGAGTIPAWNGSASDDPPDNSLTAGYSVVTTIAAAPTDTELPTAAAVSAMTAFKVTAPTTTDPTTHVKSIRNTDKKIPQWNGSNSGTLKDGLELVTEIGSSPTDAQIPTAQAVKEATDGIVTLYERSQYPVEQGMIPQWNANNSRVLKSGLKLKDNFNSTDDASVPTTRAVASYIAMFPRIIVAASLSDLQNATPKNYGDIGFVRTGDNAALYFRDSMNLDSWYKICAQPVS